MATVGLTTPREDAEKGSNMSTKFRSVLEVIAVHEAGHAVCVFHSEELPRVLAVTLSDHRGGGCTVLTELDAIELGPRAFHEGMRALCAGFLAEALAGGRPRFEGEDADKFLRTVKASATWRLMRAPAPTTRAAARVAIRRALSAAEGQARDAMRDAELLLRARWAEVELVADRLLECGGMNSAFLESTIERARRTPRPKVGDPERIFGLLSGFVGQNQELEAALRQQLAMG